MQARMVRPGFLDRGKLKLAVGFTHRNLVRFKDRDLYPIFALPHLNPV